MFCPSRLFRAAATTATELPHLETFPGAACLPTHRAAIWQSDSPPGVRSAQHAACLFRSPKFRAAQIEKRLHGSFQFQPPEPAHPLTIVRLGAPFSYGICRLHGESRREPWSAASLARPGGSRFCAEEVLAERPERKTGDTFLAGGSRERPTARFQLSRCLISDVVGCGHISSDSREWPVVSFAAGSVASC
jgi:hypothetical protein